MSSTQESMGQTQSLADVDLCGENNDGVDQTGENNENKSDLKLPEESHTDVNQTGESGVGETEENAVVGFYNKNNENESDSKLPEDLHVRTMITTSYSAESRKSKLDEIDFLKDDPRDMTWGRRLALYLMDRPWYYPSANLQDQEEEPAAEAIMRATMNPRLGSIDAYPYTHARRGTPSLAKAWAYFEHFALARYMVQEPLSAVNNPTDAMDDEELSTDGRPFSPRVVAERWKTAKQQNTYKRAEPGENYFQTKLYSPFMPHKELGDWGPGVGLYFTTLRAITIITFFAGLLSIPIMQYYASDEFNEDKQANVSTWLKGSAICTDVSWVMCTDCDEDSFPDNRIANGTNLENGDTYIFALRNNCDITSVPIGIYGLAVLAFVVIGVMITNVLLVRAEVVFDEGEQTAQDYSIVIRNPPRDAHNPNEWRDFFHNNFEGVHVTACTIGVDNDLLVKALVARRENLRLIEMKVEPGTSLDTLTIAGLAAEEERERKVLGRWLSLISPGIPEHFSKLVVATAKIQGLAQHSHNVTNVFVTFETEAAQRQVLEALSVGKHDVVTKNKSVFKDRPGLLFRGEKVLRVTEPEEPSSVRWEDLNEATKNRIKQQALTILTTFAIIILIAMLVNVCHKINVRISAFVISITNIAFPMFARLLTSFEKHPSEGGKQKSLYLKVALFRWVNTAVVISIISPFTATLQEDQGLVQQIFSLFFAEIVTTTAIQLADVGGHISRHYLAPRAKNQDFMNLCMKGSEFDLSERYTDMTKVFLLAVWYCTIFPATLFLCSLTLFVNYFTDRFSLTRTWKRIPSLGNRISAFSRQYFFSAALVAMAILSSYYWASFPFDNICEQDESATGEMDGTWRVVPKDSGEAVFTTVSATDMTYGYCLQDFFRYYKGERKFPFMAKNQKEGLEWMTEEQGKVTQVWGVVTIIVIAGILLKIFFGWLNESIEYFRGDYKPCGEDQNKPFSLEDSISAYVPQVQSELFPFPLLACNIDAVDTELFDWTDPDRPHSFYDLTKDAQFLLRGTDISSKEVFSKIVHWPPPQLDDSSEDSQNKN